MLFIRSLFYFIGATLAVILITSTGVIFSFLKVEMRYKIISTWAKFCLWWLEITCNLKIKFEGVENIPNKLCVIIANHQSTLDTLFLQKIMPPHTWVIKKQLLMIPFFGWGLAVLKPIVINRETKIKALKAVISQGIERLKYGLFVVIYPEGTRQKYGTLKKYQAGGVMLAKKAGVDILPVAHNAGKFWAKGEFIKKPGVITVRIGEVINIKNNTKKPQELSAELENWTKMQIENFE
jgi:1-acyl-sn-glycerol-3-phosphate acyltransferase